MKQTIKTYLVVTAALIMWLAVTTIVVLWANSLRNYLSAAQESGSVGLEGKINSEPPKTGATITLPRDGTTVTNLPTTISGLCPTGLLVKIYKNNVFAGSAQCNNGSFSIQIDLFSGRNELVARVYDSLDQAGPDSNTVVVTFPLNTAISANRVSLTS
jgi:hypothetical protein